MRANYMDILSLAASHTQLAKLILSKKTFDIYDQIKIQEKIFEAEKLIHKLETE